MSVQMIYVSNCRFMRMAWHKWTLSGPVMPHIRMICERICEKGPFGAHFRFWVRHMAWKYIRWASFCTLLRCASLFRCWDMLAQSVEWQEVCFRENGPKHLLPVKTVNSAYCRVTNDIITSMVDSVQHTVSTCRHRERLQGLQMSKRWNRETVRRTRRLYNETEVGCGLSLQLLSERS